MRFNFLRLFSSENSLSGPAIVVVAAGGASAIGLDCASAEARFAAELFEHRYVNYNDILSWWGLDKFASEGPPLALIFEYNEGVKVDEP
jgi:hypothetical protein